MENTSIILEKYTGKGLLGQKEWMKDNGISEYTCKK